MNKTRNIKIIPKRLRYVMKYPPNKEKGMTQKELQDNTGVSVRNIQYARTTGSISKYNLDRICCYLDVSEDYLTGKDSDNDVDFEISDKESFVNKIFEAQKNHRFDPNGVFIKRYNPMTQEYMKDFIESFMMSSLNKSKYTLKDLQPYEKEFTDYLSKSLKTSIENFMKDHEHIRNE